MNFLLKSLWGWPGAVLGAGGLLYWFSKKQVSPTGDPSQSNDVFRANSPFQLYAPSMDASGNTTLIPMQMFPANGQFQTSPTNIPNVVNVDGIADGTVIQGLSGPTGFAKLPIPASLK